MKLISTVLPVVTGLLFSINLQAKDVNMQDKNLHFQLRKPLLVMTEEKGFLACGYINVETCNKTGEACAIVTGVNNYDEMKAAKVVAASEAAIALGIGPGMTGAAALVILSGK